MKKEFRLSNKFMRVFRIVTIVCVYIVITLFLIFLFDIGTLILFIIMLGFVTYIIFVLNRRRIIVDNKQMTIVNFTTKTINIKDIEYIRCDERSFIEIKTKNEIVHTGGFLSRRSGVALKNEELVEELNKWLKKNKSHTRY